MFRNAHVSLLLLLLLLLLLCMYYSARVEDSHGSLREKKMGIVLLFSAPFCLKLDGIIIISCGVDPDISTYQPCTVINNVSLVIYVYATRK